MGGFFTPRRWVRFFLLMIFLEGILTRKTLFIFLASKNILVHVFYSTHNQFAVHPNLETYWPRTMKLLNTNNCRHTRQWQQKHIRPLWDLFINIPLQQGKRTPPSARCCSGASRQEAGGSWSFPSTYNFLLPHHQESFHQTVRIF